MIRIISTSNLNNLYGYKIDISNYFNIQENIRNGDSSLILGNNIEKLCQSNIIKIATNFINGKTLPKA